MTPKKRATYKAPPRPAQIADRRALLVRELQRISPTGTGRHTRRLLAEVAHARRTGDITTGYGPARLTYGPTGGPILQIAGWIIHGPRP